MTKSLTNLWGRFLFQGRGILPTKRLLIIMLLFSGILTLLAIWHISWAQVISLNIIILVISLVDLLYSPRKSAFHFNRVIAEEIERGIRYSVKIEIQNKSTHSSRFRFVDGLPQTFYNPFPVQGTLHAKESSIFTYEIVAPERGKYRVNKLYIRYQSLLGLWEKQLTIPLVNEVKVIPDLSETKHYLENTQQFLIEEGINKRKQQSDVGDFAKIRSYVVGDDPRKINWRQTAKLQEVMTNEYEPEHGKYITIVIDCGRMMGAELKKGNRLERSLEASITVAAAALHKGDYVGILAFSKDVHAYVPPAKGKDHLQKILQAIYDIQVDASESNYAAVFHYLQTVQSKRSLVLLFSDVGTFLHEESALLYLKKLRTKHLFLMIGIEDQSLNHTSKLFPSTVQDAMVKSMAQKQLLTKKKEKNRWEKQGLQMIEVKEERLATAAVSNYLDMINRGWL